MKRNEERCNIIRTICVIAGAILLAAAVLCAVKRFCDKYKISERRPAKKRFIDFDDADEWSLDDDFDCGSDDCSVEFESPEADAE